MHTSHMHSQLTEVGSQSAQYTRVLIISQDKGALLLRQYIPWVLAECDPLTQCRVMNRAIEVVSPLVSCVWLRHQLKKGMKNIRVVDGMLQLFVYAYYGLSILFYCMLGVVLTPSKILLQVCFQCTDLLGDITCIIQPVTFPRARPLGDHMRNMHISVPLHFVDDLNLSSCSTSVFRLFRIMRSVVQVDRPL